MIRPYLDVLRTRGAMQFSLIGFIARMPISMLGIGVVLLVSAVTRSYGLAGAVSAVAVIANSLGAPAQARIADRHGQARMLRPVIAVHLTSGLLFLYFVESETARWTWFLAAALAGATLPQIGSLVRTRWAHLHSGTPRLHTAYALESILDEVIFIVGPVLVTVLATQVHRLAGLFVTIAFTGVGGLWFATLRSTEPPPHPRSAAGGREPLPIRHLAGLVTAFLFMGGVFGSVEVITVAFADEAGNRPAAGLVLAIFAAGSMVAGVVFGGIRWHSPPQRRFAAGTALLAAAMVPLPFVPGLGWLALAMFVAGIAISPTLITGFSLVETLAPASRLTEGLAWISTALGVGVALGASAAGPVVDSSGASTAYFVSVSFGAVAAFVAVLTLLIGSERREAEKAQSSAWRLGQAEPSGQDEQ